MAKVAININCGEKHCGPCDFLGDTITGYCELFHNYTEDCGEKGHERLLACKEAEIQ